MTEMEKKLMKGEADRERVENLSTEIYPVLANIFALAIHLKRDIYADIHHCEEVFSSWAAYEKPAVDSSLRFLSLLAERMNCNLSLFFTMGQEDRRRIVYGFLREHVRCLEDLENGELEFCEPDDEDEMECTRIRLACLPDGRVYRSAQKLGCTAIWEDAQAVEDSDRYDADALPYNEVILKKYHDKKSDRNLYVFDYAAEETIEDSQAYIYMYQGSEVYEEKSGELADIIEAVLENKDKLRIIEHGEDGAADEEACSASDSLTPQLKPTVPEEEPHVNKNAKRDSRGKIIKDVLCDYITPDTRTVELMDQFEGIGENNPYVFESLELVDMLTIRNKETGDSFHVRLVIRRCCVEDCVGDITFSEYKQRQVKDLREYIAGEITAEVLEEYQGENKLFYFSKPYHLRAQNSRNLTGYGWSWGWDGDVGRYQEGTLYGETTDYGFVGAYIEY